jgi:uncharacterized protein YdhG (YjbR/CyaY superfamily)
MLSPYEHGDAMPKPSSITTIDAYLATLPADQRAALQRVRRIICATLPGIEEGISYHLPVFRHDGRWLVWMGAAKHHCALYGVAGLDKKDLSIYDISGRGTLRFMPTKPLPVALIRKIVKARAAKQPVAKRRSTSKKTTKR